MNSKEAEKLKETLETRLEKNNADADYMSAVFNGVYGVAAVVALAIIVYGGVKYVTSQGDTGKVMQAKNTILYAVIGLIVIILAAAITTFVINTTAGVRK